jgi:DNA mismatch repair ATPase MutS
MEQQFLDIKLKNPKVVLMTEHGYRYRFFGEDAEVRRAIRCLLVLFYCVFVIVLIS